ncbi:hypothetical protein NA57DRAFT_73683 [Rhizodiscina lignyota]|uniref:Uncharacterized protein n=1 Tax=Rhizodiscina lignyota TaxID=1504668 RepID=A0A9P4MCA9_9PEZI|nr:hypothetical protein NA57DRAFT_73683 [Rhizodiscina lignyota]
MSPNRPRPRGTLPRNFNLRSRDFGDAPKTPEPDFVPDHIDPPPPPKQPARSLRSRTLRRGLNSRAAIPDFSAPSQSSTPFDFPIPTIEAPTAEPTPLQVPSLRRVSLNARFLTPEPSDNPSFTSPMTPMAQVGNDESGSFDFFDVKSLGESISRPSTACSDFSDSSASSEETLESFPSFGASSASPDRDNDPFGPLKIATSQESLLSSPLNSFNVIEPPKAISPQQKTPHKKSVWTEEMDRHLWLTFLKFLQDPQHTPFKLFPGSHPPLGVCHRVAHEAKKSWKQVRARNLGNAHQSEHMLLTDPLTDATQAANSGESTPTAFDVRKPVPAWPRNASTRRRLRMLCKKQPTLSAHYQRLMQTRSPSPLPSSSSSKPAGGHTGVSPIPESPRSERRTRSAFSTRDMNISLTSSMQSGGPLSKLAAKKPVAEPSSMSMDGACDEPDEAPELVEAESHGGAHQRSHSLQLGIQASSTPPTFRMLASPIRFPGDQQPSTWSHQPRASTTLAQVDTEMSDSPQLDPPAELHAPAPLSHSLKRRARLHLDDTHYQAVREELIRDVFGATAESSHRRVRSRGFSLGDMEGERRAPLPASAPAIPPPPPQLINNHLTGNVPWLVPPQLDVPQRLGSPLQFEDKFSTVPRDFKAGEEGLQTFEPSASFEERLGAMAPGRVRKLSGPKSLGRNLPRNRAPLNRVFGTDGI